MKQFKTTVALLVAALLTMASAANLTGYFPRDTFAAFGGQNFADHEGAFRVFIDEWEQRGLTELFQGAAESSMDDFSDEEFTIPAALENLDPMDVFGEEFWVAAGSEALSFDAETPGGIVFVAALSSAGVDAAEAFFVEAELASTDVGGFTVFFDPEDEMAIALDGNVLIFAPSIDEVAQARSRNLDRSAGIAQTPAWASTIGAMNEGNLYGFFNVAALSDAALMLDAFAGEGVGRRLQGVLDAIGAIGQVYTITADGFETEVRMAASDSPNADATLAQLIAAQGNRVANRNLERFVPDGALAFQNFSSDFSGSWAWFNSLFQGLPLLEEIGFDSSVNDLVAAFTGVDVQNDVLSWLTGEGAAITLTYPQADAFDPFGMDMMDLDTMSLSAIMGDSVLVLGVSDGATADMTLSQLFPTVGMFASMMADPFGEEMHFPTAVMSDVNGTAVAGWPLMGGNTPTVYHAVTADGFLLLGTSFEAMEAALTASGGLPASLQSTVDVPANASAYQHSNAQAAFNTIAASYASQITLLSAMFADEEVDFDALENAGNALIEYLEFVASRFSYSSGYSVYEDGVSTSYGKTLINW